MGMQVGGAIASSIAQYYAGKTAKKIAEYNAKLSRMRGSMAIAQGEEEVTRHRMKVGGVIGAQRAGFAAQNILLDTGTAAEIEKQTAYWGEIDATTIRNNAALEAWGYEQQGMSFDMQGQQAMAQAKMSAFSTLVGGAGDAAKTYAQSKG
jgi:hypothetical protein